MILIISRQQGKDMNLIREMTENEFLLMLINEEQYIEQLEKIVKAVEKSHTKICYVCLNKSYQDITKELKARKIDTSRFLFIDVLTSHYKKPEACENCIFLSSPANLDELKDAIKDAMKVGCNAIIMDTVSTLLVYQEASSIISFTHKIMTNGNKGVKKIFIVLKEDPLSEESRMLVDDLNMFADKKIEITKDLLR
jgi:hypothetical protein